LLQVTTIIDQQRNADVLNTPNGEKAVYLFLTVFRTILSRPDRRDEQSTDAATFSDDQKNLVFAIMVFFLQGVPWGHALTADEVVVIANSRMAGSMDLARYYMQKRKIPLNRLLSVSVSTDEVVSRDEYDRAVRIPVRNAIEKLRSEDRISCLVLFYGMPLKVNPPIPGPDQERRAREIGLEKKQLEDASSGKGNDTIRALEQQIADLLKTNQRAALDSEIALVLVDATPLDGWLENPYFLGFQKKTPCCGRTMSSW
jgi:hypothetical protein